MIKTGASGMLRLFAQKGVLPRTLPVLAAFGDDTAVRERLGQAHARDDADEPSNEQLIVDRALMTACRFKHVDIALPPPRPCDRARSGAGPTDRWLAEPGGVRRLPDAAAGSPLAGTRDDALGDIRDSSNCRARATATTCPRSVAGSTTNRGCSQPAFVQVQARLLAAALL